ncbi:hypothetical protein MTR_6g084240 [Medicago truncatula]|uniref:Uncharacterized protein n=1 Tax=Medicago truncatula TaxID=3880 RepID=G7KN24_MEDTR|nr:hypothetical protein MTR_6g084240 [Medicago truncatula]
MGRVESVVAPTRPVVDCQTPLQLLSSLIVAITENLIVHHIRCQKTHQNISIIYARLQRCIITE